MRGKRTSNIRCFRSPFDPFRTSTRVHNNLPLGRPAPFQTPRLGRYRAFGAGASHPWRKHWELSAKRRNLPVLSRAGDNFNLRGRSC
jgi:hypothetical protein